MNVKLFKLMSRFNQSKFLVQHNSCERICRLNKNLCNYGILVLMIMSMKKGQIGKYLDIKIRSSKCVL